MKFLALLSFILFAHGVPCAQSAMAQTAGNMSKTSTLTTTIASSGTTTASIDIGGYQLVGVSLPATMTGTSLKIQVAPTLDGNYQAAYNSSGEISYTIAGGRYVALTENDTFGIRFLRLVSGSSEAGARTLVLHLKAR